MSKPRLLIADDNPLSLAFFREALASLGVEMVESADGGQALQRASASAFDLLLLDARMPVLDGADVLIRLRAQTGPSRDAIALATTADDDPSTRVALLDAGFIEVLTKPIGVDALRAVVARFVQLSHASDTTDEANIALDDAQSLATAGGDPAIAAALRGLLAAELVQLPFELAAIGARHDLPALLDRLHRLDASAGFCGVPSLAAAGARLRNALALQEWPDAEIARFLGLCSRVHDLLGATPSAPLVDGHTP